MEKKNYVASLESKSLFTIIISNGSKLKINNIQFGQI